MGLGRLERIIRAVVNGNFVFVRCCYQTAVRWRPRTVGACSYRRLTQVPSLFSFHWLLGGFSLSLSLCFASFSLAYGRFTSKVAPHRPTDRPTNQPPSIGGRRRGTFFFLSFFFDGGLGCQMVYSNGWGGRRDSMPNDVTVPLGVLTVTRP